MNDQRPTRWPCSADSSRNAGPAPRSLRKAETGVSQSSMKVWQTGIRLCPVPGDEVAWVSPASARASSTPGVTCSESAATLKQDPLGVGQLQAARAQQHGQVVEHVGGLLGDALVGLLAGGARDLLGLLLDLLPREGGVGEQLGGVGAAGVLRRGALGDSALERGQRLLLGERGVALEEARPLAGVAGGAGGVHERENGVRVAVVAQRAHGLGVPRRRALAPELVARA